MNKYLLILFTSLFAISSCKDDCDDKPNAYCQGMHEYRDGACQCPENSVDMGRYFCKEYSKNNFWIQEGDPCLGKAYFFFGKTGKDIFDEGQETVEISYSQGITGSRVGGSYEKIDKVGNQYYLIKSNQNQISYSDNVFSECIDNSYEYYDMEIRIDIDWTTADVTYKFWNDIDTSVHIKKEFGKELKAVFMSNTGPKER